MSYAEEDTCMCLCMYAPSVLSSLDTKKDSQKLVSWIIYYVKPS